MFGGSEAHRGRIGVAGDDLFRRSLGDDRPSIEDGQAIAELLRLLHEMGHQDDGDAPVADIVEVLEQVQCGPDTLIVISSDLSHFHGYNEARQIDASTCRHILEKSTTLSGEEACGARAINGLMASVEARSLKVSLLHACNSGDTAGSPNRVVGYAAFALH